MKLSILNESRRPCYGIYYWIPVNGSWELYPYLREALTFGGEELRQGRPLLHAFFWEDAIVPKLGLYGAAKYAYLGLPRGRVSVMESNTFEIGHAQTPDGIKGLEKVRATFFLPRNRTEFVYDAHMETLEHDSKLIEKQLATSFGKVA